MLYRDYPGGSVVKNLPANAGDASSILGSERTPGGGNGNPLQCSCLGNPMDRRSLVGYSPWGHKRVGHDLACKQQCYTGACHTQGSETDGKGLKSEQERKKKDAGTTSQDIKRYSSLGGNLGQVVHKPHIRTNHKKDK